jgi:hypothetical protein
MERVMKKEAIALLWNFLSRYLKIGYVIIAIIIESIMYPTTGNMILRETSPRTPKKAKSNGLSLLI